MVKCAVKGCHSYYALGTESVHDRQYQESHQVLLKNEVESLRRVLFNKVNKLPCVVFKIDVRDKSIHSCPTLARIAENLLKFKQIVMNFEI